MDASIFKVDLEKLRAGDRAQMQKVLLYGAGAFALVLLYRWLRRDPIDQKPSKGDELTDPSAPTGTLTLLTSTLTPEQAVAFTNALPDRAKKYAPMFIESGKKNGVSPLVLAGLMSTETRYGAGCGLPGTTPLPQCRGMTKEDWGLMQINSSHIQFMAKQVNGRPAYEDPYTVIMYAGSVLRNSIRFMKQKPNKTGRYPIYNSWRPGKYGCPAGAVQKDPSVPAKKGGASVPDRRPVDGMLALRAGIAGYNAGPGYPPIALGCDRDPDVVTHDGHYVEKTLAEATRILNAMQAVGVA